MRTAAAIALDPGADVHPTARVGRGTRIWHGAQVREDAIVGAECVVGKGAYLDAGVRIGDRCKIQNYACIYREAILEDGVFVGPHAVLTNDRQPRAVNPDGSRRGDADWTAGTTIVRRGASLGAHAVVLSGIAIGEWALVGAGAVVTSDVPAGAVVVGVPARVVGRVCRCGQAIARGVAACVRCGPP